VLTGCSSAAPEDPPDTEEPAEALFELRVTETRVPVLQGTSSSLTVEVVRKGTFEGAVALSISGLPEGASIAAGAIEAGVGEVTLEVEAAETAPHSLPTTVRITGTAEGTADGAADGTAEDTVDVTVTVCGHPGALDTSFATGRVVVPVGAGEDYAHAAAVAANGKILLAGSAAENLGDFALVRLERDGTIDTSFGEGGKVMTSLGSGSDVARAIAIQKDGKIVVAGSSTGEGGADDFAVVRYLEDGSLDPSFGDEGQVVVPLSADADVAYAVLVQEDGKLVLGGSANQGSTTSGVDFALLRLNSDGSVDEEFGSEGSVLTPIASDAGTDAVYALTSQIVDGTEHLLAAGGEGDFALARYTSAGELDSSFGEGGVVRAVLGSVMGAARAVRLTETGHILAAGHKEHDFALVKFDASGDLVQSFGQDGIVVTSVGETWDEAEGLAITEGGEILVGGWAYEGSGSSGNFALVRYTEAGVLDPTFGDAGIVVTEVAPTGKSDQGHALVLQPDDRVPTVRVLLAGSSNDSNNDLAVTRFWL
ncbi:MAG TPA: delta-60 repeat domain-containing protein, partial [Polyangiaceae bacterium]|nr:delta-60 repeat domain-containing protein [Polyangiaceae bacterium]